MNSVFLQPGQMHVATAPTSIITILASCVAICVFDPVRGCGGMNHFLLPHPFGGGAPGRFGPTSTALLIEAMIAAGSRTADLRAKVFGGASVLIASDAASRHGSIGEQNTRCAFELLHERGIPVVSSDTGGTRGRKVIFRTDDGSAFVKPL